MPPTAFSSAIAGPMGQSLVAQLQDDDLALHHQLKDFLDMRIRADRKYAQQLLKIAAHFRPRGSQNSTSVLNDTQVYKAWQALITFTEQFAQAVLQDSSTLQTQVKEALEALIQEKTELRRSFLQRKQQHESKLQQMDATEAEQKSDLLRAARRATEERARFLTAVQRLTSGANGGGVAAVEKSSHREKYRSCLRRVHNAHNAYVLILEEANAHCQLFEATSLPKWLDLQQQLMQLQVEQSKFLLNEIYFRLSHAGDHFRQLLNRTLNEITIIEPSTEFENFLESNKSPCVATCLREYDDKLLAHYQGNSLQEHRLILNELTNINLEKSKRRYDTEKAKHVELLATRSREAEKENDFIRDLRERQEGNAMTDQQKEELRRRLRMHLILCQSEVDEQCRVDMYSKLLNVVSRSIDEGKAAQGGQMPPVQELVVHPGIDSLGNSGPSVGSLNSLGSDRLWGRLRKSLSRSTNCKRARNASAVENNGAGPASGAAAPATTSAVPEGATGTIQLNNYSPTKASHPVGGDGAEVSGVGGTPSSPLPNAKGKPGGRGERKISQNSADLPPRPPIRERHTTAPTELGDETGDHVTAGGERRRGRMPEPPNRHASVPGDHRDPSRSPQRGGDQPALPGRHPPNPNDSDVPGVGNSAALSHPNRRELEKEPYFHGVLPRDEVQRLLREDGDFLVRESHNRRPRTGSNSEAAGGVERPFVLSVYWQGYKHFIVQGQSGSWHFEGSGFATIPELIEHHLVSGERITGQSGAVISNPVARAGWQLDNDDIQLGANIGRGNFGDVHVGWYNGKKVAVKTCREEVPEEMRRRFLDEGKILLKYNHRNIVRLIGIAAQRQPIMIVMEYVANGSLLNYLKRSKDLTRGTRLKICLDSANGMAYLESKNCIHRDLAARNCLVAEDHTIKIADFGMSREEEVYTVSEGLKQIPIKWTAPEALSTGHYTVKCDVWSYGVLMWEVYSKGSTPYLGLTNSQTREKVEAGHRMPAPEGTPSEVYDVMLRCWEAKPNERPSFGEIVAYLTRLHNDEMEGPETSLL